MKTKIFNKLMMHKFTLLILSAVMMLCLTSAVSSAQDEESRINFGRGKSSAEVAAGIASSETHTYILRVKKRQKIKIKVTSSNNKVEVDTTNLSGGQFEESGITFLNLPIDETGDYRVYVRNFGNAETRYLLMITVR
jgi:hypothetical protein